MSPHNPLGYRPHAPKARILICSPETEPSIMCKFRDGKIIEEAKRKLKQLVADLSLDKQVRQDVLRKKPRSPS